MEERGHLDNMGLGGRVILKWILRNLCEGVDWIHVAQTRDQ